ncbi:hypothetical protein CYFUS_004246 [Cystobacter fuscus]|uniref:Uncharacterized protein n=1 Tax=Cystobacter fuscus TaxID=43 RepID=A0A250J5X0_9BACT|nr:hypothetical protein CYFUS_004246 [Cystobacter fuscus]
MNRRLSFALAVVLLLLLVLAVPYCGHWWRIDQCLDAGCRWNDAQDIREYPAGSGP